jgi:hypothetical protein
MSLNGVSRADFEFGEMVAKIGTIFREIEAPAMTIGYVKLSEAQIYLTRIKAKIKRWEGFESVIGCVDDISSIVEELLSTNNLEITVEKDTKQKIIESYNQMRNEIMKVYNHT